MCDWRNVGNYGGAHISYAVRLGKVFDLRSDAFFYWIQETFESRLDEGKEPENVDKELLRLWFREHCDPYRDEILPSAPDDLVIELSHRYIRLFEMVTGKEFVVDSTHSVKERLQ